jgi:uncharacterized glyoxalase superfamily protein PhnB
MFTPVLTVRDVDLSLAFYTRVLGFQGEGGLPGIDGIPVYAEAYFGETKIVFTRHINNKNASFVDACGIELYFTLPETLDICQYYAMLKAREVNIIEDLRDEFWGDRAFTIADLDGYRLTIAQPKRYAVALPFRKREHQSIALSSAS